jgi:hypothetical protein
LRSSGNYYCLILGTNRVPISVMRSVLVAEDFRYLRTFIWQLSCGVITNNTRLQMVCSFIDTLGKYTTSIMRSLRRSSCCYWSAVDCDGRATSSLSRLTALFLEILPGVLAPRWGVLFSEARWSQRVDLAGSQLMRLTKRATRTALLEMYELTGPSHLADWSVFYVYLCWCPEADPGVDTARNSSCIVAIVGYHGNSVYRAVAWIPICVTVTSVAIW